jgi:hypothetical protein
MLENLELLDKRQWTGKEGEGSGHGVTYSAEFGFNLSWLWKTNAWYSFIYVTVQHVEIFL